MRVVPLAAVVVAAALGGNAMGNEVKGMRFQGDLLTPSLFANTEAALLPKGFLCQYAEVGCWGEGRRRMIVDEFGQ